MTAAVPSPPADDPQAPGQTRARLVQSFSKDGDLLSLGIAVARVVQLATSEDEGSQDLAYYVLADVALTQKILRIANTVFYRSAVSAPITTISRAIFVLGFDTVKTTALALLLVDNLANSEHAETVRKEIVEALCASLVGREIARQSHMQSAAEEASIASLFWSLGRLLIASHEHPLYQDVIRQSATGVAETQAAIRTMGCSYDFLTATVLRAWNFPETIVHAVEPLPPSELASARSRADTLRQMVSFSGQAAQAMRISPAGITAEQAQALLKRYGKHLQLDAERLKQLFAVVGRELDEIVAALNLAPPVAPPAAEAPRSTLPNALKLATMDAPAINTSERYESGKPIGARALLLVGVQTATQMMGSGKYKPSELVLLVLETLYSSLGFRFATVCTFDAGAGVYRALAAIGDMHAERKTRFRFPAATAEDIFHLAMENQADLMIEEASSGSILKLLPEWHRKLLPDTRSIMLLPLMQGNKAIGVFYGDRIEPAPEGITSDEAALIKTLVGQLLTAFQARS
jgi:HD-like signal output (HDOD) protein